MERTMAKCWLRAEWTSTTMTTLRPTSLTSTVRMEFPFPPVQLPDAHLADLAPQVPVVIAVVDDVAAEDDGPVARLVAVVVVGIANRSRGRLSEKARRVCRAFFRSVGGRLSDALREIICSEVKP
jgi:hypothetical protein